MLLKLSNLNSNLALTLGYLNPALNNSAQDGRNKRTSKLFCVTNVTGLTCEFCRDLHLSLIFSGLLQKDMFNER